MFEITNEADLNCFEQRAIAIIRAAFEKDNLSFDTIRIERRSSDYLTLNCPHYNSDFYTDFCRIKVGTVSTWVSLDTSVSKALTEDYRFKDEINRNRRHWKIKLNNVEDISSITDLIIAVYQYNLHPDEYSFAPIIENITTDIQPEGISDYTVFDLETTGVNVNNCKIIELTAIKVRNNDIIQKFTTLINPECHIPSEATRVNKITDEMVRNAPKLEDIFNNFISFIGDDILIGHNIASFDYIIISNLYKQLTGSTLKNHYIDTYRLSKQYVPNARNYKLITLAEYFGIELNNAHRAESDCIATHKLYQELKSLNGTVLTQPKSNINSKTFSSEFSNIQFKYDVSGKTICLTGDFLCGSRNQLENILFVNGALVQKNVVKKLDYLVIGSLGSDDWKDNKGTKLLKAEDYNQKGAHIIIIKEDDFISKSNDGLEQLTFNITEQYQKVLSENIIDDLKEIIHTVCLRNNVDEKYLSIEELKDSYSVWILEPLELEASGTKTKSDRCFKITRTKNNIRIEYLFQRKEHIAKPDDAVEKILTSKVTDKETGETTSKKTFYHQFDINSASVIPYLTAILEYSLQRYEPSDRFGCCSKYVACSDALKCLHSNNFYARCCWYRKNLEAGRIFYGKNKNNG